jgi:aerobic-type carbon monoxide dehydrogenase small subunit (CoxS/CutS family)
VLADGRAVSSCLTLAAFADGCDIVTVEHLAADGTLDPVQEALSRRAPSSAASARRASC